MLVWYYFLGLSLFHQSFTLHYSNFTTKQQKTLTHKIFNAALFSISTFKSPLARTCKFARCYLWSTCCECSNITGKVTAGQRVKVKDRKCDGWHRGFRWRVTSLLPVTRLVSKFRNSLRYVIVSPQNLYISALPVFRPVVPVLSELGDYAREPLTEITNFIACSTSRPTQRNSGPLGDHFFRFVNL